MVDDERMICDILRYYLEEHGFFVQEAHGGNDAKPFIDKHNFDVVITDVRMKDGNGIELLEYISESGRGRSTLPTVLVCSGFSDLSEKEALEKGATAMFSKPIDLERMNEILRDCVDPAE